MDIVVGSKNPIKTGSIRQACKILNLDCTIFEFEADSEENEQPEGIKEIFDGALNRALQGREAHRDCIGIGIENGLLLREAQRDVPAKTFDKALIIVVTPDDKDFIVTQSQEIELPEKYVAMARKQGFDKTTVGAIISKKLGGNPADPHSTLTKKKFSRQALLTEAAVRALSLLPPEIFTSSK